jgi:hypothetical protein
MVNLLDIKNGFSGITCLHINNHADGVLDLKGDNNDSIELRWENYFNDQIDRTWNDHKVHTLIQLRDTLLPKLMSSEVRVENKNKQL